MSEPVPPLVQRMRLHQREADSALHRLDRGFGRPEDISVQAVHELGVTIAELGHELVAVLWSISNQMRLMR